MITPSAAPADNELAVGCFDGLTVIAAGEFGIDFPSRLPAKFIEACPGHTLYLHAMHSAIDWFAYAIWENGTLQRALSLSPDPEDEDDDYPLPFHPLEMAEDALLALFGYPLEGMIDPAHLQPENIPLMHFVRKKSWWRF